MENAEQNRSILTFPPYREHFKICNMTKDFDLIAQGAKFLLIVKTNITTTSDSCSGSSSNYLTTTNSFPNDQSLTTSTNSFSISQSSMTTNASFSSSYAS
mmetsp:Transcript_49542/g.73676  ORF Transcript_49542/g.73676 Transcript_49542/m.73676 type:complete len:100 (-) Transcript_49542:354-653(-)